VLSDEVLFGRLVKGGRVQVDLDGEKLTFIYPESLAPPAEAKPEDEPASVK
jgi:hypothetical protein